MDSDEEVPQLVPAGTTVSAAILPASSSPIAVPTVEAKLLCVPASTKHLNPVPVTILTGWLGAGKCVPNFFLFVLSTIK